MPTTYVKINEEPFRTRAMRGYALGTWNWRDEPLLGKAVTHAQNVLFFWQPHTKRQYNKLAIKHNFVVYPGNTIFICASWAYTTIHTILRAWNMYHIISTIYNIYKTKLLSLYERPKYHGSLICYAYKACSQHYLLFHCNYTKMGILLRLID